MSKYPNVRFRLSVAQDIRTIRAFEKDAVYDQGRSLYWAVFKKFPALKTYFDDQNHIKNSRALLRFIRGSYRIQRSGMERAMKKYRKQWEAIAPRYFRLTEKLFDDRSWPDGKYIAYGTIWGMYPRFLENKTFQIPFRHKDSRYIPVIIAHELLHFLFYDYFYARYPGLFGSENNFFVWHVSEIFNTLVQNSPEWLHCFKQKSLGYPEHEKIVAKMSHKLYRQAAWNLDEVVDEIVKQVRVHLK